MARLPSRAQAPTPGPHLLPPRRPRLTPLALWHLLSLDAPTVATLWTLFIARSAHLILPWPAPAAMFLAVWIIYAADRLLDARLLDLRLPATTPGAPHPGSPTSALALWGGRLASEMWVSTGPTHRSTHHHPDLEPRHRFHHHHRTHFLTALTLAALALTTLLHRLDPEALHLYALLATLLAAWMLLIHIRPLPNDLTQRLPKELAVGLFFPAAIFIPTLARTAPSPTALHLLGPAADWLRPTLLPSAALFACICTLNCLYLYAWEHPAHPASPYPANPTPTRPTHQPNHHAHLTTRWATAHLTPLATLTLLLSLATAALSHSHPTSLPALACALSAAALLALNALRDRLTPLHLRATADLVLLTPLLLLPFTK